MLSSLLEIMKYLRMIISKTRIIKWEEETFSIIKPIAQISSRIAARTRIVIT